MAMNRDGRLELQKVLGRCMESNTPTKANIAVFSNEKGKILYAGFIPNGRWLFPLTPNGVK